MTAYFIDTSYLLALLATDDAHHRVATALCSAIRGPFVTTEYVLVELADSLASAARDLALGAIAAVRNDPSITLVPASAGLLDAGLALYESRSDKDWGLTDCISFVVMQQAGIADALTADRHFEQAGFQALLRTMIQ